MRAAGDRHQVAKKAQESSGEPSAMLGWSPLTWLVALLGALGGILIGLVPKYCDSIITNLALSTALIAVTALVAAPHACHAKFKSPQSLHSSQSLK